MTRRLVLIRGRGLIRSASPLSAAWPRLGLGLLQTILRPMPPALRNGGNRKQATGIAAVTSVDAKHFLNGEIMRRFFNYPNLVPTLDLALNDDSQIRARTRCLRKPA